jgi:hypothetical protein
MTTIIGTLLGVVLGAFLTIIINSGKLKIFIKDLSINYLESDGAGGLIVQSKFTSETKEASISIELDVYNSASEQKIAREIICQIGNQTFNFYNGREKFKILNVPPKTIINFKLSVPIREKLEMLEQAVINLQYKTDKSVSKRVKLR